jgi:glyceraldehyde 3-phosphate dehydrogenase (phosphorylating)
MTARIGINGFGRIGRDFLRVVRTIPDLEVVAVNDLADTRTLAHLLTYDSTYGRLDAEVGYDQSSLAVDGRAIRASAERDPAELDWGELGVDIVIESTGRFRTRDQAALHLKAGARKVIISAPGKGEDATIVMGINDGIYDGDVQDVISAASCTTNCVVPMVKVLHDTFGIQRGFMTTVHAYTGDQVVLDYPHKDLRRARSAAVNIIPTTTGAARAAALVIPELNGRLDGIALRVPVEDASLTDLAVVLDQQATAEEINQAFQAAADGPLHHVLRYTTDPIVSRDIIGDAHSCVLDASLTQANGGLAKVFGWYDNEWGYTSRLVDLAVLVGRNLAASDS